MNRYQHLIDVLEKATHASARSDPEYQEKLFESVVFVLQSTLENLRDDSATLDSD